MQELPHFTVKDVSSLSGRNNEGFAVNSSLSTKMNDEIALLAKRPENQKCADCPSQNVRYVVIDFSIFVCNNCKLIHEEIFHEVKSFYSDFSERELEKLRKGGNAVANGRYLGKFDRQKNAEPEFTHDKEKNKKFIYNKYKLKRWEDNNAPLEMEYMPLPSPNFAARSSANVSASTVLPPVQQSPQIYQNTSFTKPPPILPQPVLSSNASPPLSTSPAPSLIPKPALPTPIKPTLSQSTPILPPIITPTVSPLSTQQQQQVMLQQQQMQQYMQYQNMLVYQQMSLQQQQQQQQLPTTSAVLQPFYYTSGQGPVQYSSVPSNYSGPHNGSAPIPGYPNNANQSVPPNYQSQYYQQR